MNARIPLPLSAREIAAFEARISCTVNMLGCYEWIGAFKENGYGMFTIQAHEYRAHRIAWSLFSGKSPDGWHVCHHCDNPACVNPLHLFLGKDADNLLDCRIKGRINVGIRIRGDAHHTRCRPETVCRGVRNGAAVLTEDEVRQIRGQYRGGRAKARLARGFKTSVSNIRRILSWDTWRHLK